MTIEIDPKAIKYIDETAEGYLKKLTKAPPGPQGQKRAGGSSLDISAKQINLADVKDMILRSVDNEGTIYSFYFQTPDGMMGLSGEAMKEAGLFIDRLMQRKEIREIVVKTYLVENLFEWFKGKYLGAIEPSGKYAAFLLSHLATDVKKRTLSFPLSFIDIRKPLEFGKVQLSFYDAEFFLTQKSILLEKGDETKDDIEEHIKELRKKYLGKVVATVEKIGVKEKCVELAKVEVENFLQILRFYSPAALIPSIPSHFNTEGADFVPETHILMLENDLLKKYDSLDFEFSPTWFIGKEQLEHFNTASFNKAIEVSTKENKSKLEESWLKAVSIFNKGVVETDMHIKYVFILTALESIFIKDGNEPIAKSLSQRVAMFIKANVEERLQLIANFKAAYKRRSDYLHHGVTMLEDPIIHEFQINAWNTLYHVLLNIDKNATKHDLIASLDRQLLT